MNHNAQGAYLAPKLHDVEPNKTVNRDTYLSSHFVSVDQFNYCVVATRRRCVETNNDANTTMTDVIVVGWTGCHGAGLLYQWACQHDALACQTHLASAVYLQKGGRRLGISHEVVYG